MIAESPCTDIPFLHALFSVVVVPKLDDLALFAFLFLF